jgi:hypothetical protein
MARRFESAATNVLQPHLKATRILGVDYVFGHAESTGGTLWVVGKDPDLFNYFLPERWRRTPKETLSSTNQVFRTRTKDSINLVWRVSRLGDTPSLNANGAGLKAAIEHGYNSPFEEFSHALELSQAGVPTVYPRAIYMTGHKAGAPRTIADYRRYQQFSEWRTPDREPLISEAHEYIAIWGFWNGPDEQLAARDGEYCRGLDADCAFRQNLLSSEALEKLIERVRQWLARSGFQDLNLKPDHLLVSLGPQDQLILDTFGQLEVRLCNFELMCRASPQVPDPSHI